MLQEATGKNGGCCAVSGEIMKQQGRSSNHQRDCGGVGPSFKLFRCLQIIEAGKLASGAAAALPELS